MVMMYGQFFFLPHLLFIFFFVLVNYFGLSYKCIASFSYFLSHKHPTNYVHSMRDMCSVPDFVRTVLVQYKIKKVFLFRNY